MEQLGRDFDKIPGEVSRREPNVELKVLPNGDRVVKRPIGNTEDKAPTLEIQPADTGNKAEGRRRIKVRY